MAKFILTDLTLYGTDHVCIAMVNIKTLECIRPLDRNSTTNPKFFSKQYIEKIHLKLADVIEIHTGLVPVAPPQKPHTEDCYLDSGFNIINNNACIENVLENILEKTCSPSLKQGFRVPILGRAIPTTTPPEKSIITLKVPTKKYRVLFI